MTIDLYLVLVFVHIVLFVYWLGGDLGVFVTSKYVADRKLSMEERFRFMNALLVCDMGPRSALILFIPVGLEMARIIGVFEVGAAVVGPVWLFSFLWLGANWWMFFNDRHPMTPKLRQVDLYLRGILIVAIGGIALFSMSTGGPVTVLWLQVKLLVFAVVISLGVYLRTEIARWIVGFGMVRQGGDAANKGNDIIEAALIRSRRAALVLWFGVALAAFLGKVKPF
ncbi:MAG: hypothetical protein SFV19_17265 [Rhodospirillaceae bacterium]|nr:hypothetical protein [Rhodospirillaceae bacterium]